MSGPAGFLEFFILEASDYVEQLDRLLLGGNSSSLDAESVQRVARALRGTATMAKMPSFAELASSVERAGRAVQEGAVQWSPALGGVLVSAIDDLKTLLHSTRNWSPADDQRASARVAELARFVPAAGPPTAPAAAGAPPSTSTFLAAEATNIAAGVELVITRADDPETAANVLRRIRALRGVASVAEVRPLADALEATEDAAHGLESGTKLTAEARRVLESAAAYLRSLAAALRTGGDADAPSAARNAFAAARDAWDEQDVARDVVVPIADLFYADDASGVVEASQNPPTSAAHRFRLELVSVGEHLRRVVDAARNAGDPSASARAGRDIQRALQTAQAAAQSFGERDVASFIGTHLEVTDKLDSPGLAKLDDLAALLREPGTQNERLKKPAEPTAPTPPVPPIAVAAPARGELLDQTSAALIDSSIAALDALAATPFSAPVEIPEDSIVPIESLLYRGRAALDRAVEIRDELRKAPTNDPTALDELFDLLELARAE
jgi:chemotaxis protein histidine kinase CheA